MTATAPPARRQERRVLAGTAALAAAAWLALALVPHWAGAAGGHRHGAAGLADPVGFGLAWLVMVAAMMLPPSADFVLALRRLLAARPRGGPLLLAGMAGYALAWLAAGEILRVGAAVLSLLAGSWPVLADRPRLPLAAALALAGAYQLAPVTLRCLQACRRPAGFVARGWHGRHPVRELIGIGTAYGLSCVGCCWALMAVMLVAGGTGLWLMAVLAGVMLAERRLRAVERAVPALGAALLVAAALVALS